MEQYYCSKCKGLTLDSKLCENPSCPNMPCCSKPEELCTCYNGKSTELTLEQIESLNLITDKIIKDLKTDINKGIKRIRRQQLRTKIILWVLLIANSILAYVGSTKELYFWVLLHIIFVFLFLHLLYKQSKIKIPNYIK